eukprot:4814325-Amphidinium_carterae.1
MKGGGLFLRFRSAPKQVGSEALAHACCGWCFHCGLNAMPEQTVRGHQRSDGSTTTYYSWRVALVLAPIQQC